jgi:hypothetical protein
LTNVVETNLNLEEELEEFQKAFEKDEVVQLQNLNKFILQVSIYFQ